jgi:hypothetical protein
MFAFAAVAPLAQTIFPASATSARRPPRRVTLVVCSDEARPVSKFAKGDAVRIIAKPMVLWNVTGRIGVEVDVSGREGIVFKIIDVVNGSPITATKPVVVKLAEGKKFFMAHFEDGELEASA